MGFNSAFKGLIEPSIFILTTVMTKGSDSFTAVVIRGRKMYWASDRELYL